MRNSRLLILILIIIFLPQISESAITSSPVDTSSLLILTEGLTEFGMSDAYICTVDDLNDDTYAIIFGDEDTYSNEFPMKTFPAIARAAFVDSGRVVAVGQEGYLNTGLTQKDNLKFIVNAIRFLDKKITKKVLIDKGHSDWLDLNFGLIDSLVNYGYEVIPTTSKINQTCLNGNGVLIIGNSWGEYMPLEYAAIEDFVKSGNGLFLFGLGWSWVGYNPQSSLEDYPMNQFAMKFGLKFVNDIIRDPTNNIDGSELNVVFHNFYPAIPDVEEAPERPFRILIDQSHDYTFLWEWKFGSDYLSRIGIKYCTNLATLDSTANPDLFKFDAIFIPQVWSNAEFLPDEIQQLKEFVSRGGGLLLNGVAYNKPDTSDFPMYKLAKEFGVHYDPDITALHSFQIFEHEITQGVTEYQTEANTIGTITVPAGWDTLITDSRGKIIGATGTYGKGRVMAFADHFLINWDATHNHTFVENIAKWLSANLAGRDSTFHPVSKIYPENVFKQGIVTYKYAKNLEQRTMFLHDKYDSVMVFLEENMGVDCIYNLIIIALASGGGGYSGGQEVGIGVLASDEFTLAVYAHELTHSHQHPGGEPGWMGEGWAVMSAERTLRKFRRKYEAWAQNEYQSCMNLFHQYDPMGKTLDLDAYGSSAPIAAYTGKFMWLIENLESKYGKELEYGNDFMRRYFQLRRKYYDPAIHGQISTQKSIYFLSWAAGEDLFMYFKTKRTRVDEIPVHPVVYYTQPENGDTLTNLNSQFSITFNAQMDSATLNSESIRVVAEQSGIKNVSTLYVDSSRTLYIRPTTPFDPGESVLVEMTSNIKDVNGNALDGNGSSITGNSDGSSYFFTFTAGFTTNLKGSSSRQIPHTFSLSQNYPNPFNNSTSIAFSIPTPGDVSLHVVNTLGQHVETIIDRTCLSAGDYKVCWNAEMLSSGIYFICLEASDYSAKRKIVLLR